MAAFAVAAVSLALPARSQPQPAASTALLPSGTTLTFILDDTLSNPKPRPGTTLRVHLRDAVAVGSLTAAAAGASDRIRISTTVPSAAIAAPEFTITIAPLSLGAAGQLPLTVVTPVIPLANLVTGTPIAVRTAATLNAANGRISMHIPLPFALTNDAPYADWTPIPMRTAPTGQSSPKASNREGRGERGRRGSPAPSSSPSTSVSPSPAPSATLLASPMPSASPTGVSR